MSIVKMPVREGGVQKQWRAILQGRDDAENKRIKKGGIGDGLGKGEIKSINDDGFGDNRGGMIIRGGVKIILAQESVSRAHLRARGNNPFNVEVLKE